MKIGLAFDLKPAVLGSAAHRELPDDQFEEFDSPQTVTAIAEVLRGLGYDVVELGGGRDFLQRMLDAPPDLVFNFAEGHGASRTRESRVPAVCEMLNIPYTGSDPLTLGLALDKDMARRVVEAAEVKIPDGIVITFPEGDYDGDFAEFPPMIAEVGLTLPLIAKPVWEGSSKGIRSKCLVRTAEELGPVVASLGRDYGQPVLVEEFIAGDEVTVAVMGNDPPRVLGCMRILPQIATEHFVYSLEVKREYEKHVRYESPAQLPSEVMAALEWAALTAYEALGCRDLCRLDFRIRDGVPYFLEANPLPGLNPITSDLVLLAKGHGVEFPELIRTIVEEALGRIQSDTTLGR